MYAFIQSKVDDNAITPIGYLDCHRGRPQLELTLPVRNQGHWEDDKGSLDQINLKEGMQECHNLHSLPKPLSHTSTSDTRIS